MEDRKYTVPERFLDVILKLTEQNSCEETILVPSGRLANLSLSSWFNFGPKAKLLTKITLMVDRHAKLFITVRSLLDMTQPLFSLFLSLSLPHYSHMYLSTLIPTYTSLSTQTCRHTNTQLSLTDFFCLTYVAELKVGANSGDRKSPFVSSNSPYDLPYQSIHLINSLSIRC